MDPFELLKKDHKKVSELLKQLQKTEEQDSSTREELFPQLRNELDTHTRIEETIFYPALKQEEDTEKIALEAYEEHNAVKRLLQEMGELDYSNERWGAKCTLLKEMIEHHVEEEEGEMFKKARKVLNEEELEHLGEEMMLAKSEATGPVGDLEGEELKDEDSEDLELEDEDENKVAAAESRSSRNGGSGRSSSSQRGNRQSERPQASAARWSGSRSRSKSSVKSSSRKGSKKRSASKKRNTKKASRKKSQKKSNKKSSRRR